MRKTSSIATCLTLLLSLLLVFSLVSTVLSSMSEETVLDDENGAWLSLNTFTYFTIDELDFVNGPFSYKFYTLNTTEWMKFGYVSDTPLNLSHKFFVLWLKIQNISFETPLTITLKDTYERNRRYWDVVEWVALDSMRWARIALDTNNYKGEDSGFNVSQVVAIDFFAYNGGKQYSQIVWIEDPSLMVYEKDAESSFSNDYMALSLVSSIIFIVFVSFCAGFLIFHFLKIPVPYSWNFALLLPLYTALGIISLVIVSVSLSLFFLDFFMCWFVIFILTATFLIVSKKKLGKLKTALNNFKDVRFLLPVLLLGFSFGRFAYLALDMGWAPLIDPQTHGMFTSLILHHQRIPASYYPVGNMSFNPFRYPLGYHIFSAFVSVVTCLYPGQSILAVATAIVLLFPSLLYTMVYFCSKSVKLSFLAFLLTYFLPGNSAELWRPSHDMLLGNFLVGTYPNMLGNLIFMVFLILVVNFDGMLKCSFKKVSLLYGLLTLTLAVSYYPLLPFLFVFPFLTFLIGHVKKQQSSSRTHLTIIGFLVIFVTCFLLSKHFKSSLAVTFQLDNSLLYSVYMRYSLFSFDSQYSLYTIFILIAVPFSLWFLFRNEKRNLGLLYLILLIPLMAAQNEQLYSYLFWFTQPDRALILLVVCSYCIILIGFREHLWPTLCERRPVFNTLNKMQFRLWANKLKVQFKLKELIAVFLFLLLVPSLLSHVTYSYHASYHVVLPHGNDFEALQWLANNVNSSEVILNDRTVMGFWTTSFKAMNVINDRDIILKICLFGSLNGSYLANRTLEVNKILDSPWDYEAFDEIASKYLLSYIYISENSISLPLARGMQFLPFPWKYLTEQERIMIYLENPRLKLAYRSGNAVIFQVKN